MGPEPVSAGLHAAVGAALHRVVDPCSLTAKAPLSLVDMGLVDWTADDATGQVAVRLWVTGPSCVYGPRLAAAAEREIRRLEGVTAVDVSFDHDVLWSPSMMTPTGRAALAARRSSSLAAAPVRPRQWELVPPDRRST